MLISTIKYTFLIPKTRNRICREHLFFSTTLISIDFSVTIYESQIVKKRVNSHWCHTLLVKRDANEKKKGSLKINNLRLDQQSCFLFYLFLTKKVNLCEWRNDFSQSVGWVFMLSFCFFSWDVASLLNTVQRATCFMMKQKQRNKQDQSNRNPHILFNQINLMPSKTKIVNDGPMQRRSVKDIGPPKLWMWEKNKGSQCAGGWAITGQLRNRALGAG